jgi:hypothetical protein
LGITYDQEILQETANEKQGFHLESSSRGQGSDATSHEESKHGRKMDKGRDKGN